jgi:hypothetical protein
MGFTNGIVLSMIQTMKYCLMWHPTHQPEVGGGPIIVICPQQAQPYLPLLGAPPGVAREGLRSRCWLHKLLLLGC